MTQPAVQETEQDETILIPMPMSLEVLVFRSTQKDVWIAKVAAKAVDIRDGRPNYFGQTWEYEKKPSRQEIAEQVVSWLKHEVAEQLGLKPHHEHECPEET